LLRYIGLSTRLQGLFVGFAPSFVGKDRAAEGACSYQDRQDPGGKPVASFDAVMLFLVPAIHGGAFLGT